MKTTLQLNFITTSITLIAFASRLADAIHLELSVTVYGKNIFGAVTHLSTDNSNDVTVTWEIADKTQAKTKDYWVSHSYRLYKNCDQDLLLHTQWTTQDYPNDVTSITLSKLQPWQTYLFKLKASKIYFYHEEVVNGTFKTHNTGPTGTVQNLRVPRVTDKSATIAWDMPPCDKRGGPLVRFDLLLDSPSRTHKFDAKQATEVKLQQLTPNTTYTVRVRYVSDDGPGPYSKPVTFQTLEYNQTSLTTQVPASTSTQEPDYIGRYGRSVPLPPSSLKQVAATKTCITLSWEPPSDQQGIYGYDVFDLTSGPYAATSVPLASPGATVRKTTVCDLQPGRQYKFGISSRGTNNNRSQPAEKIVKTEQSQPPKPLRPKVVSIGDKTVVVEILRVQSQDAPITSYQIIVAPSQMNENEKVLAGRASSPKGYVKGDLDEPGKAGATFSANNKESNVMAGKTLEDRPAQEKGKGATTHHPLTPPDIPTTAASRINKTTHNTGSKQDEIPIDLARLGQSPARHASSSSAAGNSPNSTSNAAIGKVSQSVNGQTSHTPRSPDSAQKPVGLQASMRAPGTAHTRQRRPLQLPFLVPLTSSAQSNARQNQGMSAQTNTNTRSLPLPQDNTPDKDHFSTLTASQTVRPTKATPQVFSSIAGTPSQARVVRGRVSVKASFTVGGQTNSAPSHAKAIGMLVLPSHAAPDVIATQTQTVVSDRVPSTQTQTVVSDRVPSTAHRTVAIDTEAREIIHNATFANGPLSDDLTLLQSDEKAATPPGNDMSAADVQEVNSAVRADTISQSHVPVPSPVEVSNTTTPYNAVPTPAELAVGSRQRSASDLDLLPSAAVPGWRSGGSDNSNSAPHSLLTTSQTRSSLQDIDATSVTRHTSLSRRRRQDASSGNVSVPSGTAATSPNKISVSAPVALADQDELDKADKEIPSGMIVADLPAKQVEANAFFVVGDGRSYGGHVNSPLDPYARYDIYVVAYSQWGDDNLSKTKFSISDPAVVKMPQEASMWTDRDGRDTNIIVISVMVTTAFTTLVFVTFWRVCRQQNTWNVPQAPTFYPLGTRNTTFGRRPEPPPLAHLLRPSMMGSPTSLRSLRDQGVGVERHWSVTYDVAEPRYIVTGRELLPPSQVIVPSLSLPRPMREAAVTFQHEFHCLPSGPPSSNRSAGQFHYDRNLTPSVLPFDATRVVLDHDGTGSGDYYNASYITGYTDGTGQGLDYIAGQSPFDDASVLDIWRLIYQNSVTSVVVLSRIIEDGTLRCMQYWPEMGKAEYGPFKVAVVDQFTYAHFTERLLSVRHRKRRNAKVLLVRLFCFTGWPDRGVPQDSLPLLELRSRLRKAHGPGPNAILVHCETGAGRSAVFIAVDMALTEYVSEGQVSVFAIVARMRAERPRMVHTFAHYAFIYEALFEELHAGDTWVGDDLRERYQEFTRRNPNTNRSYLRDQFVLLQMLASPSSADCHSPLGTGHGLSASVPDLIPARRFSRPTNFNYSSNLWQNSDDEGNAFEGSNADDVDDDEDATGLMNLVNAVFVDGYRRQNEFIMAPTPLAGGVVDFWQLVYDNGVQTIVAMDTMEPGPTAGRCGCEYWPAAGARQWDPFFVELMAVTRQDPTVTVRSFKLVHMHRTRDKPRFVRQFQFHAWGKAPADSFTSAASRRRNNCGDPEAPSRMSRGTGPVFEPSSNSALLPCPPPSSKAALLDLLELVREWQHKCSLNSSSVLVHCTDGATCSGLLVALSLVVSRMEEVGQVSIYRIVRTLRKRSPATVPNFDQYKYLYKVLWDYMNLRMRGCRCTDSLGPSIDSPAPDEGSISRWNVRSRTDGNTVNNTAHDADMSFTVTTRRTSRSRSPERGHILFSDNWGKHDWMDNFSINSSSSSSITEGKSPLIEKKTKQEPQRGRDHQRRAASNKGTPSKRSPELQHRHVQRDAFGRGCDGRPLGLQGQDGEVYRFKPHTVYPRLGSLSDRDPRDLPAAKVTYAAQGTRTRELPTPKIHQSRSPPRASATPPRSTLPCPSPSPGRTARPGSSVTASPGLRRHESASRPAVSAERPSPSVSPGKLLTELSTMGGSDTGAVRSESVLQEITEMMDEYGLFYRQELTDHVRQFSSTSNRSDTNSDTRNTTNARSDTN